MGTRSTTVLMNDKNHPIAIMYRQYDGYPSGHGKDLVNLLKKSVLVNGFSSRHGDERLQVNGMNDCAVLIITALKNQSGSGGIYLYSGDYKGQESYHYTVYAKKVVDTKDELWQNPEAYRLALKCESKYHEKNNGVIFDDIIENLDPENLEPVEEETEETEE